jgi:hypothetical protein
MATDGEYVWGHQLRSLLESVRFGLSLSVEDLESAYNELCIDPHTTEPDIMKMVERARVSWFAFEEWYVDYFTDRDATPQVPDEGATTTVT